MIGPSPAAGGPPMGVVALNAYPFAEYESPGHFPWK
jgi:hypothetical protein